MLAEWLNQTLIFRKECGFESHINTHWSIFLCGETYFFSATHTHFSLWRVNIDQLFCVESLLSFLQHTATNLCLYIPVNFFFFFQHIPLNFSVWRYICGTYFFSTIYTYLKFYCLQHTPVNLFVDNLILLFFVYQS